MTDLTERKLQGEEHITIVIDQLGEDYPETTSKVISEHKIVNALKSMTVDDFMSFAVDDWESGLNRMKKKLLEAGET